MGERITFRCNGTMTPGYLARPATGRGPGIVVIQEWWGLVRARNRRTRLAS